MESFNNHVDDLLIARDATYEIKSTDLDANLFVGEKALIYLYAENYNAYSNFWLTINSCKNGHIDHSQSFFTR